MTLFNFNLPIGVPLEPAVDAVSDYPPDTCTICETAADR